jgi:ABC-type multidrug transport system fused ATPase/permease subunit
VWFDLFFLWMSLALCDLICFPPNVIIILWIQIAIKHYQEHYVKFRSHIHDMVSENSAAAIYSVPNINLIKWTNNFTWISKTNSAEQNDTHRY